MSKLENINYKSLPLKPGVYIFKNESRKVLYVGKSKFLRKRVRTYFENTQKLPEDKQLMIPKISEIDHIVTDTELEALLLETTLIKKHRPKHNILLKDDKNYQYIKIDNNWDFPKIYATRNIDDKESQYFGPFTDGLAVKQTIEMIRKLFKYRTCDREIPYDLSKTYSRPCLNHHIKLCLAPCIGAVTREEYESIIHNCVRFLQGKQTEITSDLKLAMKQESAKKNFERAAILRDQLEDIAKITAKQKMVSTKKEDLDIVSFYRQNKTCAFNVFLVREGNLTGKENFSLALPDHPSDEKVMSVFLERYYSTTKNLPKKIVVEIETKNTKIVQELIDQNSKSIILPQKGRLKKLVELGKINAREFWLKQREPKKAPESVLAKLKNTLELPKLPRVIEAYDISNLQGTNPTGSMIVFQNAKPKKSAYRHFKIKREHTPDDVHMMQEILVRRLGHQQDWPLPDLILIDGGKPQLNAIARILLEHKIKIPLISLAKREEEIFILGKNESVKLAKNNSALQLLQRLRDEAHRFAISHHKKLRKKTSQASELDNISGIGPKTKQKLLSKYGSLSNIRKARSGELENFIGKAKAKKVIL